MTESGKSFEIRRDDLVVQGLDDVRFESGAFVGQALHHHAVELHRPFLEVAGSGDPGKTGLADGFQCRAGLAVANKTLQGHGQQAQHNQQRCQGNLDRDGQFEDELIHARSRRGQPARAWPWVHIDRAHPACAPIASPCCGV